MAARQKATELVRQAREAMAAGQLDRAEAIARQADQLRLPDSVFAPGEDRPGLVLLDIRQFRSQNPSGVVPAGGQYVVAAGGTNQPDRTATRALYDPAQDRTRNVPAANQQPIDGGDGQYTTDPGQNPLAVPRPPAAPAAPVPDGNPGEPKTPGMALFEQGETALKAHDAPRAYELFREAAGHMNELDPVTARRLQDYLQMMSSHGRPPAGQASPLADEAAARQQALLRQVAAELAHAESNARALRETDPKAALAQLEEAKKRVAAAGLDASAREQLSRSVDRAINETQQIIEKNRPQIELAEKNNRVRQEVEREQKMRVEVEEKLAMLIDECNKFMDEQEYEKAEIDAKRAAELVPDNPVVAQLLWKTKFAHRVMDNNNLIARKEQAVIDTLGQVDESSVPFSDKNPMVYPDAKDWSKLSKNRAKFLADRRRHRTEREIEIEKKLETPVSLQFTKAPLGKVMDHLADLVGVNVHLDELGLTEEGVSSDTPVTINLRNDIMLKSALNLILQPLHLSYVVKDDVLKITSEQMHDNQVYTVTYNVADLVMPIPNFVPGHTGLASAYDAAMGTVGFNGSMPFGSATAAPMQVAATRDGKGASAMVNPNLLAQVSSAGGHLAPFVNSKNGPVGAGPGGLGGGTNADFDSLIDLIKTTVKPTSWDDTGGTGTISQFATNLSLVVSQTQEVHEELADLLEQLRRLQDLQVTIEVRFITLNDNFFERVGVSFDFSIQSNVAGKGLQFGTTSGAGL